MKRGVFKGIEKNRYHSKYKECDIRIVGKKKKVVNMFDLFIS